MDVRWPLGVAVFVVGYVVGWLVAVVRHRRGRLSVTIVADGRPKGDDDV